MARWTLPHEQSRNMLFLFHLAIQGAAQKLALQRQMNRARGRSVVRRSKGTEQCDYVVTHVRIYLGRIFGAATPLRALVSDMPEIGRYLGKNYIYISRIAFSHDCMLPIYLDLTWQRVPLPLVFLMFFASTSTGTQARACCLFFGLFKNLIWLENPLIGGLVKCRYEKKPGATKNKYVFFASEAIRVDGLCNKKKLSAGTSPQ